MSRNSALHSKSGGPRKGLRRSISLEMMSSVTCGMASHCAIMADTSRDTGKRDDARRQNDDSSVTWYRANTQSSRSTWGTYSETHTAGPCFLRTRWCILQSMMNSAMRSSHMKMSMSLGMTLRSRRCSRRIKSRTNPPKMMP